MNLSPERIDNLHGGISVESRTVFSYPLHTHTYCEMILYEPFDGKVAVNGKEIEIKTTTAVILSPLDSHQITVKNGGDARYVKVGFHLDTPDLPPVAASVVLEGIEAGGFLPTLFCEIRDHAGKTPYLTRLVGCAVYHILDNGIEIPSLGESRHRSVALAALKMINEGFRTPLPLPRVAQQLSVTPQYLSFAFKLGLGINFSQYLAYTRLQYAAHSMLNTRESITDICFDCGFENFSHFSRSFKRLFGISPREYRSANAVHGK
jgi:AraC-like DNA-binding protein